MNKYCALNHVLLFPMQAFTRDVVVAFSWIYLEATDKFKFHILFLSKLFHDVHEALMVQVFCLVLKIFAKFLTKKRARTSFTSAQPNSPLISILSSNL